MITNSKKNCAVPLSYPFAYAIGKTIRRLLPDSLRHWKPRTPIQATLAVLGTAGALGLQQGLASASRVMVDRIHEYQADSFAIHTATSAAELASAAANHGHKHNECLDILRRMGHRNLPPQISRFDNFTWKPGYPSSYSRYERFLQAAKERVQQERTAKELAQQKNNDKPLPTTTDETENYLGNLEEIIW